MSLEDRNKGRDQGSTLECIAVGILVAGVVRIAAGELVAVGAVVGALAVVGVPVVGGCAHLSMGVW